ncbi:PAAR domain-containing protein [Pseudomonas sp. KBW05]|uniref:PAAR domain-containing protein n=1 Tax=Pseudomonas sp. KBW05 TaxID=2153360 RepID=UPI0034CF46B3
MRRYNLTNGAKTTAGGTVYTGYTGGTINGLGMVRQGDLIFCPACSSQGVVVCVGRDWVKYGTVQRPRWTATCAAANVTRHLNSSPTNSWSFRT